MEVLTREIIGLAELANLTVDGEQALALNLARGNAAIINEIRLEVAARYQTSLNTNIAHEARYGVALDATLLAPGDLAQIAGQEDADLGEGRGLLEVMSTTFTLSATQNTTDGFANAISDSGHRGLLVDYRGLRAGDRPMTTENPALLAQVVGSLGTSVSLYMYYQVVRLTEAELGRLSGDIRPTVLRVANIPEAGAVLRKVPW